MPHCRSFREVEGPVSLATGVLVARLQMLRNILDMISGKFGVITSISRHRTNAGTSHSVKVKLAGPQTLPEVGRLGPFELEGRAFIIHRCENHPPRAYNMQFIDIL